MKQIIVKWEYSNSQFDAPYGNKCMRVIESNHPRFVVGYRFDYGFAGIASEEGYEIIIKPL